MSKANTGAAGTARRRGLSLEGWAALLAFALAALVRAGLFKHLPW